MSPALFRNSSARPGQAEQDQLQKPRRKPENPMTYPQRRSYTQRINDGSIFGVNTVAANLQCTIINSQGKKRSVRVAGYTSTDRNPPDQGPFVFAIRSSRPINNEPVRIGGRRLDGMRIHADRRLLRPDIISTG